MSNKQHVQGAQRRELRGARILVIEDEKGVADQVRGELMRIGADVKWAPSGELGLRYAFEWQPHAVVLDLAFEDSRDRTGLEVCRELRLRHRNLKIVVFTISANLQQAAIRQGASAYIVKTSQSTPDLRPLRATLVELLTSSGVVVDSERQVAVIGGRKVSLTNKQCQVLSLLSQNSGAVITDDDILEQCWGAEYVNEAARAKIHDFMMELRRAIEPDPNEPRYLRIHLGIGYSFSRSPVVEAADDLSADAW